MALMAFFLAVAIDAPAAVPPVDPIQHNYLNPPADGCDRRDHDDEVVVCGSKDLDARYRLQPTDDQKFDDKPVRAQAKVLGGNLKAHVDDGAFGTSRMMITLTIPF
jgi:hypothetical protein